MITAGTLPASVAPPTVDADAARRAGADWQMAMLTRLAEIGIEIAEAAGRRAAALAQAGDPGADAPDPALAYSRVARAVASPLRCSPASRATSPRGRKTRPRRAALRLASAPRRIRTRVERAIETERDDADEVEQLSSDIWERLTETDDAELLRRPVAEAVALFCADLGL